MVLEPGTPAPPGVTVLEASACTVMPGLFDGHIHFRGAPMWQVESVDRRGWGKMAKEAYSLFQQQQLSLLGNGVTTIVETGSP